MIGKSYIEAVDDLLRVLNVLLICWDIVYFQISSIVFFIAIVYWIIDGDGISNSVILRYIQITSRVKTSLLGPIELLMALKNI